MRLLKYLAFVVVFAVVMLAYAFLANRDSKPAEDNLALTVDCTGFEESFEIGQDIVVSTDVDFSSTLPIKNTISDANIYVYEFKVKNLDELDAVYVKPPVLYTISEITPVSAALAEGETIKQSGTETDWLSIESVDVESAGYPYYSVNVVLDAKASNPPRFPKLCFNGGEIKGATAMYFDDDGNYDYSKVQFDVPAGDEEKVWEILKDASLVIDEVLSKADTDTLKVSSNVEGLSVIVK